MSVFVLLLLCFLFPQSVLSQNLTSIFIDSLSIFSSKTAGSFQYPLQNFSQALPILINMSNCDPENQFEVSIFLKTNQNQADSSYYFSEYFILDMSNMSKLSICSYNYEVTVPPNQCVSAFSPVSSYLYFMTMNSTRYAQDFLALIRKVEIFFGNLNINLAFQNPKIIVMIELFEVDFYIYNCSLNVANINGALSANVENYLTFFSLVNSNLMVNNSIIFNSQSNASSTSNLLGSTLGNNREFKTDPFELVIFTFQYLQIDILTIAFYNLVLDSCQVNIVGSDEIIEYIRILEVDGDDRVAVIFANNYFADSLIRSLSNKHFSKHLLNSHPYLFSIKIISSSSVSLYNNMLEAYQFENNSDYKSFRLDIMNTITLSIFNETYYNIVLYMVFSNIDEVFLSQITISTNATVAQQMEYTKYTNNNYLLLYISDYGFFMMDTLVVKNYAISKSILIEFEPTEFGNYTLMENLTFEKTSGTIYFLFEPNIYVKAFDYDKAIDIKSCYFTNSFNGGLIFAGLISASITHILLEDCQFYNITNNDFEMHMKSPYYLPVPLIFLDSLTAKDIILKGLTFKQFDSFVGDFINIILERLQGSLRIENIEFSDIKSKNILSFLYVQAPIDSKTDIYLINFKFVDTIIKNNLIAIRSLESDGVAPITTPFVILQNVLLLNVKQKNYEIISVNDWDMNIYFVIYIYYPKIYLFSVKITNSSFSYKDHNLVLSASKFVHLKEFVIENLQITYPYVVPTGSVGHFLHITPFYQSFLFIDIANSSLNNISFVQINKKEVSKLCDTLQFFIFVFSLKNSTVLVERSHFSEIVGNCQTLTIFSFSQEFLGEKEANITTYLLVKNSHFSKNEGYWGSVLYCEEGTVLFFNNTFLHQKAKTGGVAYCGTQCNLTINASMFLENKAEYGRILALETDYKNFEKRLAKVILQNNSFLESYQTARSKKSSGLFYFINLYSFIYDCEFSTSDSSSSNIFWYCQSTDGSQFNKYQFNFPSYINIGSSNISSLEIDSKNFTHFKHLIDIYISQTKSEIFDLSVFTLSLPFSFQFDSKRTLIQVFSNQTENSQNIYKITNFTIKSLESNHFSLLAYANDYNNSVRCAAKNCISPFLVINMNECEMGSIFNPFNPTSKCTECSQSYILPFNADSGKCEQCPVFASCDNGIIAPKEGFWRSQNFTDKIYYCSGGVNSCLGGFSSECELGYKGAMCKACDVDNGFFKGMSETCGKCTGAFALEVFFYWLQFIIFLLIEVYIVYSDSSVLIEHEKNNFGEIQDKYSKKDQLSRLGNILFTYLQIVSLLEFFGINLPQEIFSFAEFFVNPNNGMMYSQYCLASFLNFDMPLVYVNLIFYIFGSVLRLLLLLIIWNIIGRWRLRQQQNNQINMISEERNTFVNFFAETKVNENEKSFLSEFKKKKSLNYWFLSFIGWFLIEDIIVLREVFLMFCVKIEDNSYINKDFNYQCDEQYYAFYLPYLIYPVIFIYGAIIPLYLYGTVALNRKNLKKPAIMNKFGPLYLVVKPKFFYWPFVNYLLKYSIIIIGVFGSLDPVKIVALLIVLICYSVALYLMQPYIFHSLNRLEIISCWIFVVTLTFSQTQILSNIYVSLKYLNYEKADFHWISSLGYFVILFLNFGFVGFLALRIVFLLSHRIRRYLIRIKRYFSKMPPDQTLINLEDRDSRSIRLDETGNIIKGSPNKI